MSDGAAGHRQQTQQAQRLERQKRAASTTAGQVRKLKKAK